MPTSWSGTSIATPVPSGATTGSVVVTVGGVASNGASFTVGDITPPTAPTSLTATPSGGNQINLSWIASTDNVGVTGYLVERCARNGCSNFAQIGTTTATTYSDTGLSSGTTYRYRVRAIDSAGNLSGYSNIAKAKTP